MKASESPVIVEQIFNVPIIRVWKAITDLEEMKQWYFSNIDAFKPEIGSRSSFIVMSGERVFTHLWEVSEVVAPSKIVYNWRYAEYPGDSFVSWELFEEREKTRLVLMAKVVEDFPDEIPEFKRESCIGGWQYFIQQQLKAYLEGN